MPPQTMRREGRCRWSPARPTVWSRSWNLAARADGPTPCWMWALTLRGARRVSDCCPSPKPRPGRAGFQRPGRRKRYAEPRRAPRASAASSSILLPLREKVSAQLTDAGSRRPIMHYFNDLLERLIDPSSDLAPQGMVFSRKGRRVPEAITAANLYSSSSPDQGSGDGQANAAVRNSTNLAWAAAVAAGLNSNRTGPPRPLWA